MIKLNSIKLMENWKNELLKSRNSNYTISKGVKNWFGSESVFEIPHLQKLNTWESKLKHWGKSKILIEAPGKGGMHFGDLTVLTPSRNNSGNHLFSILFNSFFWTSNTFRRRNGTEPRAFFVAEWSGAGEKCLRFKKSC